MIEPACVTMHPIPGVEIVHFFDARDRITSRGDVVTAIMGGELHRVVLPLPRHQRILAATRLSRRALRLDKCNVVPTGDRSALMIAHQGVVYRYGLASRRLEPTYRLRQCRNMMHQSVLAHGEASLYFGEYGANPGRDPVDVVASHDAGRTWEVEIGRAHV